jgi:peptide/nickel transport system permease protein
MRLIRAATLSFRKATFVKAAWSMGAGTPRLPLRHVLPNLFGPIIVLATITLSTTILAEAGLSFPGFSIPSPTPSWGQMLSGSSALYIYNASWLAIFPGVAITRVVFGASMFGDALRDELDPRLKGARG